MSISLGTQIPLKALHTPGGGVGGSFLFTQYTWLYFQPDGLCPLSAVLKVRDLVEKMTPNPVMNFELGGLLCSKEKKRKNPGGTQPAHLDYIDDEGMSYFLAACPNRTLVERHGCRTGIRALGIRTFNTCSFASFKTMGKIPLRVSVSSSISEYHSRPDLRRSL